MKTVYLVTSSRERNKIDSIHYVFLTEEAAKIYIEEAKKVRDESNQMVPEFKIHTPLLIND